MENNGKPNIIEETRLLLNEKFKEIVFDEVPHKYYINNVEYTPVSHIIEKFTNPFDKEAKSKSVALKRGVSQEDVLREWKYTNLCSTIGGTRVHLFGEAYTWLMANHPELIPNESLPQYVKEENWLIPTFPKEIAVKKFYEELPLGMYAVGAEFRLSTQYMNVSTKMCGTTDILLYYEDPKGINSGFIVADWKTNASLTNDYARNFGLKMFPPFEDMIDEALSHYTLQFNLYQRMLESVGLKIIARRLIWLKNDGTYETFKIDKIDDKIIDSILM